MADGRPNTIVAIAIVLCLAVQSHAAQQYLGKFLGRLSELHHGVSGEVYAVDAKTLHIKDFTYDGEGPAAYFWAGTSRTPGSAGFKVRDENGSGAVLKRYRKKGVTITLPDGKNLNNIKWFSVWCDEFAVNFGDVKIPKNFDYPKPQKIEGLRGVHGVSSDSVVLVDAQTLLIPNLSYDGEAPDAKFWVGRGAKPSPQGIRVPDENSKEVPLRRYDRKTVVLTLPGDLTVFDIGHFGIWCEAFTVDFGHVRVPANLNIPPSLKMLGVSPQSKLNCEVLYDDLAFEVRWAVAGESIVLQLVAKLDDGEYMSFGISGDNLKNQMIGGDVVVAWVDRATLKGYADDYFLEAKSQCSGPTGSCPDERLADKTNNIRLLNAAMVNGYSIVTYQRPLKPSDEFDRQILTNQSQAIIWAVGPLNQRNEVSFHSHFTKKDQLIDFGRPAKWNCPMPESDSSSQPQTTQVQRKKPDIVAAVPDEPSYPVETTTRGRGNERRRGGNRDQANERRGGNANQQQAVSERSSQRQEERPQRRRGGSSRQTERGVTTAVTTERARTVPTPKPVSKRDAWHIPAIQCYEPDDGVFYAQMGPTGGKKGYPAITGHVGWGISWYINGLLIPEINVVRGKTYTFVVEGGLDPEVAAKYHPFYITDDPIGGYEHKTPEEKQDVRIFAGAKQTRDGKVYPTGIGRLCHWTHTGDLEADEFQSFGAFQRTLELRCDDGEPGVITWTPDKDTPDTVYYQCFTHRHLGWKINVLDSCDAAGSRPEASEPEPAVALPDNFDKNGDLSSSPSLIYETRIKTNDILFQTTQTNQAETDSYHPDNLDGDMFHQHFSGPEIITIQPDKYDTSRPIFHLVHQKKNQYQPNFGHFSQFSFDSETPRVKSENLTTATSSSGKPFSDKFIVQKPNLNFRQRPKPYGSHRRPVYSRPPPFIIKPMIMQRPQGPYKKSYYRIPMRKQRPHVRPVPYHQKLSRPKPNEEPILIMKHADLSRPVQNVEISTITPITSTQVIESVTAPLELSLKKDKPSETLKQVELPPAINTGFHPESVVIEGGFKPIVTHFEDRMIETDDSDYKDDIGVIRVTADTAENHQYIESFEPMFIPSPPDSRLLQNKTQIKISKRRQIMKKNPQIMFIVKHVARSADIEEEPEDDEMAMAAERVEAYYLPPDDKKPVDRIKKPSNIDIPPGTVVTYDGKTVSGVSLTAPVEVPGEYEARSSKAAELLRLSPQFGPFRGEIPPLDPNNINVANLAQLNTQGTVINRDLNAPSAPATSSAVQTTKLSPVRRYRRRRNAHHTPEHTAEQEKLHNGNHTHHNHNHDHETNASIITLPNNLLGFITVCCIIRYIKF